MNPPTEKVSLLFRAAAFFAAVFVVTVLALVVSSLGGGGSPIAKFLNNHGVTLIGIEAALTLVVSISAMTVDRLRYLRGERARGEETYAIEAQSQQDASQMQQPDQQRSADGPTP